MKIEVKNLVKTYKLSNGNFNAVDDVSLHVEEGERVGIIGRNGSGKSTLLSIIAGLQERTSGEIEVEGHIDCIMTLGVGIREKATGRENIYIDAEINGKTRKDVDKIIDKIIDFSELGDFIDHPVGTYSTGMKSRLAFSMIIFMKPEILIIDEALSAGDAQFGVKATNAMKDICRQGKILLLVSHSMEAIRSMCNRVIWINSGKIMQDGSPDKVIGEYLDFIRNEEEYELEKRFNHILTNRSFIEGFSLTELFCKPPSKLARRIFRLGEDFTLEFSIQSEILIKNIEFQAYLERSDGNIIWSNNCPGTFFGIEEFHGDATFEVEFNDIRLGADVYELILKIYGAVDSILQNQLLAQGCAIFKVEQHEFLYNAVWHGETEWEVEKI